MDVRRHFKPAARAPSEAAVAAAAAAAPDETETEAAAAAAAARSAKASAAVRALGVANTWCRYVTVIQHYSTTRLLQHDYCITPH